MKEILEQENINSEIVGEKILSEEEKELLIEKIENDESLDCDTSANAIIAVELFSVDYENAIKIAEMVNLLWEGRKRIGRGDCRFDFCKTKPEEEIFREKVFPIAKTYKDIQNVSDIPKEIIDDINEFKNNFEEYKLIDKFCKEDKSQELFDKISNKIKETNNESEFQNDPEWLNILNKLDQVNVDFETLKKDFREVWITKALLDFEKKQNNLAEGKENKFRILGFEKCDEFSNEEIEEFLDNNFGQELLTKSLIRQISYSPTFRISGDGNFYDEDKYLEMESKNPNIKDEISRGSTGRVFVFPSVVDLYNHKHGDISKYRYLDDYAENDKIKAYLLGTIVHEIGGHHFFDGILKLSERIEYEKVCQNEEPKKSVTHYIEKVRNGLYGGNIYSEDFSDSMRRFMTDYDDFKEEFPKRVEFIEKKFPEIKKNGIKKFIDTK